MKKRAKRIWTVEQKAAAAERMKGLSALRWAQVRAAEAKAASLEEQMDNDLKASVAVLELPEDALNVNAENEHPTEEPIRDVARVGSHEVVLRVRTDGQMASLQGPCVCGARKREWHQICLKQSH